MDLKTRGSELNRGRGEEPWRDTALYDEFVLLEGLFFRLIKVHKRRRYVYLSRGMSEFDILLLLVGTALRRNGPLRRRSPRLAARAAAGICGCCSGGRERPRRQTDQPNLSVGGSSRRVGCKPSSVVKRQTQEAKERAVRRRREGDGAMYCLFSHQSAFSE
jgi:hypothetical protein